MIISFSYPVRWFAVWAALALSAAVARSPDLGTPANAAEGTRLSTVDLAKAHSLEVKAPVDGEFPEDPAKQKEIRATYADRAVKAGAELVWDSGGPSLIGISPVLYADPALALPGTAPVKVLAVDMAKLYDNHPRTKEFNARIQADDAKAQKEVDTMNAEGNALVDAYKKLLERGDKEGAAKKLEEIEAKRQEVLAFIKRVRELLEKRLKTFRDDQLMQLSGEAVKAARKSGATLVLDTAGPSLLGVSPVVYVDAAVRPAAEGGVGSNPARAAYVRTVDLGRLYDAHPRTLEMKGRVRADEQRTTEEIARLNKEGTALVEEYKKLAEGSDPAAAEKKLNETRAKAEQVKTFTKESRELAKKRLEGHRTVLLHELGLTVGKVAERAGATVVLDTAGRSLTGVSHIAHAAPALDLTAEVAKELGIPLPRN